MTRRPIEPGQVGRFSIDDANNSLYWDDELIHTETSVLQLTKRQGKLAFSLVLATVISTLVNIVYTGCYIKATLWPNNGTKSAPPDQYQKIQNSLDGMEIDLHAIRLSIGASATPPVVPPSPVSTNTYSVVFGLGQKGLTDSERQTISEAAQYIKSVQSPIVFCNGYTDMSGSFDANMKLSIQRAAAVSAQLVADGVPGSEITSKGYGPRAQPYPSVDIVVQ